MRAEETQKQHYERIQALYDAHYDDVWSRRYRERFIEGPLLDGLDLRGRRVLEAMCGSGLTTVALLARGASVVGLDIADAAVRAFRTRWPQCEALCTSITNVPLPGEWFDAVVIVGGLHHLHPHVEAAVTEIHRLLKPRGWLCFMEPHTGTLPDWFRRRWYRLDPLFMANEAAVDLDALQATFADRFEVVRHRFGGNLAFLLVANSMAFRIPLGWKRFYSPALLRLEAAIGAVQPRALSCFAVGQWRKR